MNQYLSFHHDEAGVTATEYAVLLALILLTLIGAVTIFGQIATRVHEINRDTIANAANAGNN